MISTKAKDLISTLITDAAWSVGVTSPNLKSRTDLEDYIHGLEEALRYLVECNDVAMPDPVCQQWMGSPCRAECMKALENK